MKRVIVALLIAVGVNGCEPPLPPPPPVMADCATFDREVQQIPGLVEGVTSRFKRINKDYYIRLGLGWCVDASNDVVSKEYADEALQKGLLLASRVNFRIAVKPENREMINAFGRLAQKRLCPSWDTEEQPFQGKHV